MSNTSSPTTKADAANRKRLERVSNDPTLGIFHDTVNLKQDIVSVLDKDQGSTVVLQKFGPKMPKRVRQVQFPGPNAEPIPIPNK
jgi:hypothetical protein